MSNSHEPLDVVRAAVEPKLRLSAQNVGWTVHNWLGRQLVRWGVAAAGSTGLAVYALPTAAAASAAGVIAVLLAFCVGQRIQYVRLEGPTRWSLQIANRCLKRDVLKAELALRQATLLLAGDRRDRQVQLRMHAPGTQDFVKILRYDRGRRAAAATAERPQPPKARVRQAAATPKAPDVASVRRRRDLIVKELAVLEEEIQALAVPQDGERAELAAVSRRTLDEQRSAANRADRDARDRARRGLSPVPPDGEVALKLTANPHSEHLAQAPWA